MERKGVVGFVTRVGGPERVRAILRRFYARLASDPLVGFFFAGRDLDDIVTGQLGFLLKASGESDAQMRRHPSKAHLDLPPILRGHFNRRLTILREVLEQEGVRPCDLEAGLGLERSMRAAVQAR